MATSSSVPPTSHEAAPAKHLRPELAALVRALSALPEDERVRVYAAVNEEARSARPTLTWDDWDRARGSVSLGGNAVDDCDELYDGA
jgi:hypothetical protein